MATNHSKWLIVSICLPQVFLVVSLYTPALVACCALIWIRSSQKQDTQSLISPLICFQNKPSQTYMFWIPDGTTDLHAWSATVVQSSTDQISVLEDPGWVTFMVRLMRSGSERCSQLGDKTKPQMSLTPSVDYFHWWFLTDSWDPELLTQTTRSLLVYVEIKSTAVTKTTTKCATLPAMAVSALRGGLTINLFLNLSTEKKTRWPGRKQEWVIGNIWYIKMRKDIFCLIQGRKTSMTYKYCLNCIYSDQIQRSASINQPVG